MSAKLIAYVGALCLLGAAPDGEKCKPVSAMRVRCEQVIELKYPVRLVTCRVGKHQRIFAVSLSGSVSLSYPETGHGLDQQSLIRHENANLPNGPPNCIVAIDGDHDEGEDILCTLAGVPGIWRCSPEPVSTLLKWSQMAPGLHGCVSITPVCLPGERSGTGLLFIATPDEAMARKGEGNAVYWLPDLEAPRVERLMRAAPGDLYCFHQLVAVGSGENKYLVVSRAVDGAHVAEPGVRIQKLSYAQGQWDVQGVDVVPLFDGDWFHRFLPVASESHAGAHHGHMIARCRDFDRVFAVDAEGQPLRPIGKYRRPSQSRPPYMSVISFIVHSDDSEVLLVSEMIAETRLLVVHRVGMRDAHMKLEEVGQLAALWGEDWNDVLRLSGRTASDGKRWMRLAATNVLGQIVDVELRPR